MKVLPFPGSEVQKLTKHAREADARAAELRRFLEKVRDSSVDLHIRVDRMEATLNTLLREVRRLVRERQE